MKKIVLAVAVLAIVVGIAPAAAQTPTALDTLLRTAVEQKRVPMIVAMVADAKGVIYEQAVGAPKDAIFAIASMTKPVTSIAVMRS